MTQEQFNTVSRKGKHLPYQDRCQIAILKQENYSNRPIAQVMNLSHSPQAIHNEVNSGTITQVKQQKQKGKAYRYYYEAYDADAGQTSYDRNRLNCGRRLKWPYSNYFIDWDDDKMLLDKWSPDTTIGFANRHQLLKAHLIPCTPTLYHWIDTGIMKTKNLDLLEKLSRNTKKRTNQVRRNRRVLGQSIELRPKEVDSRESFGYWEIDTIIGNKRHSDSVLLTLVERQSRYEVTIKINGKTAQAVDEAIQSLRQRSGSAFTQLFKTITSDNVSVFAGLHDGLSDTLEFYFTHPYTSWVRGTSENQYKLIQRFIPKSNQSMKSVMPNAFVFKTG